MRKLPLAALAVSLVVGLARLGATTINFESHSPADDGAGVQNQDGYVFTFSAQGWGIFSDSFVGGGAPYTHDGTERLVLSGGNSGGDSSGQVTMTAADASWFSLTSFDAATMFPDMGSGQIELVGTYGAGGTVSQIFTVLTTFSNFTPSAFTGLSSLTFRDTAPGGFRSTPGLSLDNLVVNVASASVPDSGTTIALLGLTLTGLAAFRRRS